MDHRQRRSLSFQVVGYSHLVNLLKSNSSIQ
jgi:hypothetical protein